MAAFAIPQDEMVRLVINPKTKKPISKLTLIRHFRVELDRGMTNANVRVMTGMFKNATTPTEAHPGGHPILQIFWAKSRLGWQQERKEPPPPPLLDSDDASQLERARRVAFAMIQGARMLDRQDASEKQQPKRMRTTA